MKLQLIGAKLIEIRNLTQEELEYEGWDRGTKALVFDNGCILYASKDEEGNGSGALFGMCTKTKEAFSL